MPKDIRTNSFSIRPRASPYACSSKNSDLKSERSLPPLGNEREWEDTRCPICMEHPHNAVLLLCSSREKGCQPYMCDTSYRHSNCLDQYCKSSSVEVQQEGPNVSGDVFLRGIRGQALSGPTGSHGQQQPELLCPLCRGHVNGWIIVEAARKFMNSKTRSCSLETCNFVGNYAELRKHARREHPSERPSEADPTRQSDWSRLEIQRGFEDALSAYEAPVGGNIFEDSDWSSLEIQRGFEDALRNSLSVYEAPVGGNIFEDFFGDEFLIDPPLDSGLFDLLDGYSEADEGLSEDINMLLDIEYELSFSVLNEFPLVPLSWDGSPSIAAGRSASQSARSQNRRYRRSASRSNNRVVRPAAVRSRNPSSSRTSSSSRDGRWDR